MVDDCADVAWPPSPPGVPVNTELLAVPRSEQPVAPNRTLSAAPTSSFWCRTPDHLRHPHPRSVLDWPALPLLGAVIGTQLIATTITVYGALMTPPGRGRVGLLRSSVAPDGGPARRRVHAIHTGVKRVRIVRSKRSTPGDGNDSYGPSAGRPHPLGRLPPRRAAQARP